MISRNISHFLALALLSQRDGGISRRVAVERTDPGLRADVPKGLACVGQVLAGEGNCERCYAFLVLLG